MQPTWSVFACLALAVAACDQPLTPSSPSSDAFPRIAGVVRDSRGAPIGGATVTVYPGKFTAVSNDAGEFRVAISLQTERSISASKLGYEPTFRDLTGSTLDLVLHDIIKIGVGQSIRITVRPEDSSGIDENADEYRYRLIRLVADESVTAELRVVADDNGPASVVVRNSGPCCRYDIPANSEVEVEIRIPGNAAASRAFTLVTYPVGS